MAYRSGFPFGPVGGSGMFDLRREIDRLFEDAFGTQGGAQGGAQGALASGAGRTAGGTAQGAGQGAAQGRSFTPAVDAREEQHEVVLHMDLPGVRPEDVDISVENGLLTVRGQRHQQRKEGENGRYQFVERSYGSFYRAFQLPPNVDESQIKADFEHGELTIRIPKPALPQPRKVQIGTGAVSGQASQGGPQGGVQAQGVQAQGASDQGARDM